MTLWTRFPEKSNEEFWGINPSRPKKLISLVPSLPAPMKSMIFMKIRVNSQLDISLRYGPEWTHWKNSLDRGDHYCRVVAIFRKKRVSELHMPLLWTGLPEHCLHRQFLPHSIGPLRQSKVCLPNISDSNCLVIGNSNTSHIFSRLWKNSTTRTSPT